MYIRRLAPLALLLAALAVGALALACSSASDEAQSSELMLYNWEDYLAPDLLENFEAEFGITVVEENFDDEEVAFSAVQSNPSRYDVIVASDDLVRDMSALRLLAKIDQGRVPNLANIAEDFRNQPWDPGNQYSVPYTWGSTGVIYNTDLVDGEVDSWWVLWDAELSGHVAMLNNPSVVIGTTLKALGYPLNTTEAGALAQAEQKLVEQRPLLQGYLDPIEIMELVESGDLWAAQLYNGDAILAMEENEQLAFVIPKEGSDVWVDNLVIPRDAQHKDAAETFMNYILRPDVQAAVANYNAYATPNSVAIEQGLIDEELLSDPAVYPDLEGLEWWQDLGAFAGLWNEVWANVQTAELGIAP